MKLTPKKPGERRSPRWPAVAQLHLAYHPRCEACGSTINREVHHIIPVSYDAARELDPANLMTLCEGSATAPNCHLLIGHLGSWNLYNAQAPAMARQLRQEIHDAAARWRKKREAVRLAGSPAPPQSHGNQPANAV